MEPLDPRDIPFSLMRWSRPVQVGEGAVSGPSEADESDREALLRALLGGR